MSHRILMVGLGPLGLKIAADLLERGAGTVAAAVDSAPALAGRSLRDAIGPAAPDQAVLDDLNAVKDWKTIDAAIVATSSDLRGCAPTFRDLLARGIAVVSTCEELVWPYLRHADLAAELHASAVRHAGRLLGTGVNPGFLMDTLPVVASAVCKSVRSVSVRRIQDASSRRIPFQQKIGAGLDDAEFTRRIRAGTLRHVGLGESLHFIAHFLGLRVDRWEESIEPVPAERDMPSAVGPIRKGLAAGVRQVAHGYRLDGPGGAERPVVTLEFQAAIGQPDPHDRVVIEGEPPLDLVFRGGVHGDIATSALAINCIPRLLESPPGLHTMASIPLARFNPAHAPSR